MTNDLRSMGSVPRPAARRRGVFGVTSALLVTGALVVSGSPPASASPGFAALAGARPASSSTVSATSPAFVERGLFGRSDPTYDGVYRQGLAILGLRASDVRVPASAVRWLRAQQCRDGGFASYRAPGAPCPRTDLSAFTGEDTNSTALAAMALLATNQRTSAGRALRWLRSTQRPGGGFPYLRGAPADANSTGLALSALATIGRTPQGLRRGTSSAYSYLRTLQLRCAYPRGSRGALAYQSVRPLVANDLATPQALTGLSSTLIIEPGTIRRVKPTVRCSAPPAAAQIGRIGVREAAAGYLARALLAHGGGLDNSFGGGKDWNATAWAVLGLRAAGLGRLGAALGDRALRTHVNDYTLESNRALGARPAALGTLLLVAHAGGANPRRYGGVNLVFRLRSTLG